MGIRLSEIAHARSGDKGDSCNIGVAARAPQHYDTLRQHVTADRVKEYFSDICLGTVTRYELPNLNALNFVLTEVLDGGGTRSLRIDPQGKLLCDALMLLEIDPSAPSAGSQR